MHKSSRVPRGNGSWLVLWLNFSFLHFLFRFDEICISFETRRRPEGGAQSTDCLKERRRRRRPSGELPRYISAHRTSASLSSQLLLCVCLYHRLRLAEIHSFTTFFHLLHARIHVSFAARSHQRFRSCWNIRRHLLSWTCAGISWTARFLQFTATHLVLNMMARCMPAFSQPLRLKHKHRTKKEAKNNAAERIERIEFPTWCIFWGVWLQKPTEWTYLNSLHYEELADAAMGPVLHHTVVAPGPLACLLADNLVLPVKHMQQQQCTLRATSYERSRCTEGVYYGCVPTTSVVAPCFLNKGKNKLFVCFDNNYHSR